MFTDKQYAAILITHHEGFISKPAADQFATGVCSIGFGTTRMGDKPVNLLTPECTREQATKWVEEYIDFALNALRIRGSSMIARERGAFVSLAYNIGIGAALSSRILTTHGNALASAVYFTDWVYSHKAFIPGLLARRQSEMFTYLTGEFMFTPTDDYKSMQTVA